MNKLISNSIKYLLVFFLLIVTTMSYALTFTVTVPSVTNACYIAGNFNGWNPTTHKMTKIDTNKYQIEIDTQGSSVQYKYCSGQVGNMLKKLIRR